MAVLHDLLAILGEIDGSVDGADNPEWAEFVEKYLPGTTKAHQQGWYGDVQIFVRQLAPNPYAGLFPSAGAALRDLNIAALRMSGYDPDTSQSTAPQQSGQTGLAPRAAPDRDPGEADDGAYGGAAETPGTPEDDPDPFFTTTNVAQMLYVTATLAHLVTAAPTFRVVLPDLPGSITADSVDGILGIAGQPLPPPGIPPTPPPRDNPARRARIQQLADLLFGPRFTGAASWPAVMTAARTETAIDGKPLVDASFAGIPLLLAGGTMTMKAGDRESTAGAAVTQIDGIFCVVLTTDSWRQSPDPDDPADTITVGAVKSILDPVNWAGLSTFFARMDKLEADSRGASQVLEYVSTSSTKYRMKTKLKYWKEDFGPTIGGQRSGIVNYELADKRIGTGDSMMVSADSGYLHVGTGKNAAKSTDGVRIRTSKMVAIQGASVTATAVFFGLLGWGAMSDSMLFDHAPRPGEKPGGSPKPWQVSPEPVPASGDPGKPGTGGPVVIPQLPEGAGGALISEAAQSWARFVLDASKTAADLTDKWYRQKLQPQDLVNASAEFGARLASEPWQYLERVRQQLEVPTAKSDPDKPNGGSAP